MIVIAKNAEMKLLQELRKEKKTSPGKCCFYLGFSRLDIPKREAFEAFLKLFQDLPNSYMAQIYVCQDTDIFILFQGFAPAHFQTFLDDLTKTLNTKEIPGISKIYEIGMDWFLLESLCNEKKEIIARKEEEEKEQKRKMSSERATLNAFSNLDLELISTIERRRKERTEPLVLIVDDDQLSRTLAGNVLREDYQMAFAKDGKNGLTEYVEHAPDIVFLDIGMPDISGHEVLESLFQIDPFAYIIMFSGRKDQSNMLLALRTGAQGFLGKPFTRQELYQHVGKSPFVQTKLARKQHPTNAVS